MTLISMHSPGHPEHFTAHYWPLFILTFPEVDDPALHVKTIADFNKLVHATRLMGTAFFWAGGDRPDSKAASSRVNEYVSMLQASGQD